MEKLNMVNITIYVFENDDVYETINLQKDAINDIRKSDINSIYIDCVNDLKTAGTEFFQLGYTTTELTSRNLHITSVSSAENLINVIGHAIKNKGAKKVYINLPDTYIDQIRSLPKDFDFTAMLMYLCVEHKNGNINTPYSDAEYYITVKKSAFKSRIMFEE